MRRVLVIASSLAALLSLAVAVVVAQSAGAASSASGTGLDNRLAHTYFHLAHPNASTSPTGLSPATIKSVYSFPTSSTAGAGKTIAIVDAFDDPTAESDLAVFSAQYGLPACTTANGCFSKVNQTGGTSYPRKDAG